MTYLKTDDSSYPEPFVGWDGWEASERERGLEEGVPLHLEE